MPDRLIDLERDLTRLLTVRAGAVDSAISGAHLRTIVRPGTNLAPALAAASVVAVAGAGLAISAAMGHDHGASPGHGVAPGMSPASSYGPSMNPTCDNIPANEPLPTPTSTSVGSNVVPKDFGMPTGLNCPDYSATSLPPSR
jgi:hypothetical protein